MRIQDQGFLSPRPQIEMRFPFDRVAKLRSDLPELIAAGSDILRKELRSLPVLNVERVTSLILRRALMRDYHVLQSAFVKADPEVREVPASLAVPSFALARSFGSRRPPVLTYESVVLENWTYVRENFSDVRPIATFTRTQDEAGFLMTHVLIERAAGDALCELQPLTQDARMGRMGSAIGRLNTISRAVDDMLAILDQMEERCKPSAYAKHVRPWLDKLECVRFEAIVEYGDTPQKFTGASGAQSSVLAALDAALGIRHENGSFDFMPREHVALVRGLSLSCARTQIASFAKNSKELRDAYNGCLESIRAFRVAHASLAIRYVHAQGGGSIGTGGSLYREFLKAFVQDTESAML